MAIVFYSLVVLLQVTASLCSIPAPSKKCKASDSDCLKTTAQAMVPLLVDGISDLGIESLDALHIDDIKLDLLGLKIDMTKVEIKGLKKSVIDKVNMDMDKKQLEVVFHGDAEMSSQYKASGKVMVLPITGDGVYTMKMKNSETKLTIPFTIVKKDGKDTIQMKEFKAEFEIKGGATFSATNLFNGNKTLSEGMLKFLNENWKTICEKFAGTVMKKPNKKIFSAIKKYMQSKPLAEFVDV